MGQQVSENGMVVRQGGGGFSGRVVKGEELGEGQGGEHSGRVMARGGGGGEEQGQQE